MELSITPGAYGDFEQSSDDVFRLTGHGAAKWTWTPQLEVVLGAAYVDRQNVDVLPICGLIWTPHDEVEYKLVFPTPRIARRVYWTGVRDDDVQDWLYVGGEFGGGNWAIERPGGSVDQMDYGDLRVFVGIEREAIGRLDYRFEIGYVFDREIQFASGRPRIDPGDTLMLRARVTY
jgi:hypothetical protein